MGIKDLLLNKGWAGRTIDRAETIERVNPLIKGLTEQLHYYEDASSRLGQDVQAAVAASLRTLRADIGKLCETVYSCGGVAYSGTDIEPGSLSLGEKVLQDLFDREEAFCARLEQEAEVEHQIRTRAVLEAVRANGAERLKMIRSLSR